MLELSVRWTARGEALTEKIKKVAIYRLVDPTDSDRVYIGSSINPELRFRQHLGSGDKRGSVKCEWVASLLDQGLEPRMEIIEWVDGLERDKVEHRHIRQAVRDGYDVLNTATCGYHKVIVDEELPYYLRPEVIAEVREKQKALRASYYDPPAVIISGGFRAKS